MGKTLGEMTPEERDTVIRKAAAQLQDELQRNAPAIAAVLDRPQIPDEMRAHDERTADLHDELGKAQDRLGRLFDRMHEEAGDRKDYRTRNPRWQMGMEVVRERLLGTEAGRDLLQQARDAHAEAKRLGAEIDRMEGIYNLAPWQRYFPCRNTGGHIHATLRGCSTVYATTLMGWYPSLSGKTIAEAVAELGPALCTVCFPDAPVEMTGGVLKAEQAARGEREAARAERARTAARKRLVGSEQFIDHRHDRVETVARCKEILREERELFWYYGRGPHPWHEGAQAAAAQAKAVLLAREAREAGAGATQAEIDTIVARADKKHRKEAGQ